MECAYRSPAVVTTGTINPQPPSLGLHFELLREKISYSLYWRRGLAIITINIQTNDQLRSTTRNNNNRLLQCSGWSIHLSSGRRLIHGLGEVSISF